MSDLSMPHAGQVVDSIATNCVSDIPRRFRIDQYSPAELAIRNAMLEVEKAGADVLLTEAVNLLDKAREKVADYVDKALKDCE